MEINYKLHIIFCFSLGKPKNIILFYFLTGFLYSFSIELFRSFQHITWVQVSPASEAADYLTGFQRLWLELDDLLPSKKVSPAFIII